MTTDSHSGRDATNSGSDSGKHYGKLPTQRYSESPTPTVATRTTGTNGSVVRDEKPSNVPGSAVRT